MLTKYFIFNVLLNKSNDMRAILLIFLAMLVLSCKETKVQTVKTSMKDDVSILANDSLKGRKTGSEGERKAAAYIAKRFENIGLQPKGTDGFYQKFTFKASKNP